MSEPIHFLCPKHQAYENNGPLAMMMLLTCPDCAHDNVARIESMSSGFQKIMRIITEAKPEDKA